MIFINPPSGANTDIPNIGLAYAATHFNVKVIDLNSMPRPYGRFLKEKTDVLGISVRSLSYGEALKIAKLYKEKYPGAQLKSISGFLDIQCCYPYVDFEDKISYNEQFSDEYPFPGYELFDSFSVFQKNWAHGVWSYAIMTSHGCPYQCIYCASKNRKWIARSAENCFEELRLAQKRWKIKSFQVLDDCFNIDKKRVIRFCQLIHPLRLTWYCSNGIRADRFDEEIAFAMSESGCEHLSFGIESADSQILKEIKKGETIEQIENAVNIAKRYFKSINGFFIIGLPKSSYEKDLNSLNWAKKMGINAHFSYYVPFDEQMYFDEVFYGESARPVSSSYSQEQQKKLYKMTAGMRPGFMRSFLKKILVKLKGQRSAHTSCKQFFSKTS